MLRHLILRYVVVITFLSALFGVSSAARAGGTHFLVEPYTGMVFSSGLSKENSLGLESGAFLAVGGKFKGFPPRFYLYFRASQTFFGAEDVTSSWGSAGCVERSYTALLGGLRIVIPLWAHLRLNIESGAGSFFSQNSYSESGFSRQYSEELIVVEVGAGLNWRLFRWLSLGVMYDYTFVAEDERGDLIASILDEDAHGSSLGWSRVVATIGFHF